MLLLKQNFDDFIYLVVTFFPELKEENLYSKVTDVTESFVIMENNKINSDESGWVLKADMGRIKKCIAALHWFYFIIVPPTVQYVCKMLHFQTISFIIILQNWERCLSFKGISQRISLMQKPLKYSTTRSHRRLPPKGGSEHFSARTSILLLDV